MAKVQSIRKSTSKETQNNPESEYVSGIGELVTQVDHVPVPLYVLEELRDGAKSLEHTVDLLKSSNDETFQRAGSVLCPLAESLKVLVDSNMPDLEWFRKRIIKAGLGRKILGGSLYDDAEIDKIMSEKQ